MKELTLCVGRRGEWEGYVASLVGWEKKKVRQLVKWNPNKRARGAKRSSKIHVERMAVKTCSGKAEGKQGNAE